MPPKGWRRNLPPPGYVFRQKESAARFEGLAHSGDLPLANAPKRDRVAQLSGSPVKKKPRTEESTPSGSSRKRTSQKRESVSLDRGIGREVEGGGGQQQWNDEEEEEEVEEEQPQEEEEDPEDPVWVGFREDFYEIVDQLPLELQRSFALLRELDEQVDSNTTELSTLVRRYVDKRLGHAPPSLPPPSSSAITSPSSRPTATESEGNAVAGPSGYNGAMDIDDEDVEAVASAVELEACKDPSLPPPSPSAALPSTDLAPPPLPVAPPSQKPLQAEEDPMDLLTSPASASNPPKSPTKRSPSIIPATPSPIKTHSQPSLAQTDSAPDPLSLSQETNPDILPSSTSAINPSAASALPSSAPTLLLPITSHQPPTQQQQKQSQLSRIANLLTLLLKAGEEKVAVAKGAYDRVDRQIRSLDSALTTHAASITTEALAALAASASASAPARKESKEVEIQDEQQQRDESNDADGGELDDEEQPQHQAEEGRSSSRRASVAAALVRRSRPKSSIVDDDFHTESEAEEEEEEDGDGEWETSLGMVGGAARKPGAVRAGRKSRKGKGKGRSSRSRKSSGGAASGGGEAARGGVFSEKGLEGMAVDPNEPRYCYCQNVSYGQMIGCDNDECPSEWFHLQCVGMETPVIGKWFCRDCDPHRFTKKRLI